ncbi:hypothetical protein NMG60_11016308 [Bertholletia excelsa]
MERFTQRDNILPDYNPQRAVSSQSFSPKSPFKRPDIDFHDVFGGPPRRSSMQERRYSFAETMASTNSTVRGDEGRVLPRDPWSGLHEVPVFGDETANRRRYQSEDFFDDIFRGDESVSSPRRSSHDPFGSTPGSRVLSPARFLPPRADPSGTSLPAQFQFSVPPKLTKATDFPAFASGNRSPYRYKDPTSIGITGPYTPSSLSRVSSCEAFKEEAELRKETKTSHNPSPLSLKFSLDSKEPSNMKKSSELVEEVGGNLKTDMESTVTSSNGNQFHFSIYRWASKGVPMLMPLRRGKGAKPKDRFEIERCSSSNGRIESNKMESGDQKTNLVNSDLHILNHGASVNYKSSYAKGREEESGSLLKPSAEDRVESGVIVEEEVLSMPGSTSVNKTVETVPGEDISSDRKEENRPHPLSKTDSCESIEKEIGTQKPELKSLYSLLYHTDEGQGSNELVRESNGKDRMAKKKTFSNSNADGSKTAKKHDDKKVKLDKVEARMTRKTALSDSNADVSKNLKKHDDKKVKSNKIEAVQVSEPQAQDSSGKSGAELIKNGVKGKVKEFVKIFNQEATSQARIDVEPRSHSSRWRNNTFFGADTEGTAKTSQTNGKFPVHNVNMKKTPPNASVTIDKIEDESEKQKSHLKAAAFDESKNSIGQTDASASNCESPPDSYNITFGDTDDLSQDDFVIKELSNSQEAQVKRLQTEGDYEDIKTLEAKIQKWSNGKEGNIRSLLSTLQYVLWTGSGWKPVPLVDIIEGTAVKKAYQKALLCLHPDKLQQKGAASHQKYIAERVFDILQEAWDNFNTLSAI